MSKIKKIFMVIAIFGIIGATIINVSPQEDHQVSAYVDGTYIGEIRLFPYDFAPDGWLKCDGSLLPISSNTTLYSLIGIKYGGNGISTFGIPDLRGAEPLPGTSYYIAIQGLYPTRP
ncbi:phage tail protein [Evansella tamaricis]|uniref:Tail fiber protein n=1 Tax=Evansella tamaricis TaxID=2069301 RepID=A0ABS6JMM7_9BACI|nr:tail fiber protein [Evansella tamaricis]MBU9714931.1 tail fiber protein [Evansella tamaricis]